MTGKLEIRLLNYFLLIALAALMIGIEFFFEMSREDLNAQICQPPPQTQPFQAQSLQTQSVQQQSFNGSEPMPLRPFRNKIVIMFAVLMIVVAIVLMMFIKNITNPLQKMANVARRINDGDLSQIVPVESGDEIGQVGTAINELTSNLQEVATFTTTTANQALEKIKAFGDGQEPKTSLTANDINEIRENLDTLLSFVEGFTLLHTEVGS